MTEGNAVEVKTESPLLGLAERCEQEAGPSRELDAAIAVAALGWIEIQSEEGDWRSFRSPSGQRVNIPRDGRAVLPHHDALQHFTASLDAAMTLLPKAAANIDIFSYSNGWACRFHDRAQLMGERAANEEIARLQKTSPIFNKLRGEPLVIMEKAIAEHWLEFMCLGAKTAALALCAAALKARAATPPLSHPMTTERR